MTKLITQGENQWFTEKKLTDSEEKAPWDQKTRRRH